MVVECRHVQVIRKFDVGIRIDVDIWNAGDFKVIGNFGKWSSGLMSGR